MYTTTFIKYMVISTLVAIYDIVIKHNFTDWQISKICKQEYNSTPAM